MYKNPERFQAAQRAEHFIRSFLINGGIINGGTPPGKIGIILGTGWGDALNLDGPRISFPDIPGFEQLGQLEGHKRQLVIATIAGKTVYALDGRVHLNEAPDNPNIIRMVRLQTEMLLQLGVEKLIVTSAVGALPRTWKTIFKHKFQVGEICVVDGLVTVYAPPQPVWGGEFYSPEDTIDARLQEIAMKAAKQHGLRAYRGGHAMVQGSFFESRSHDKHILANGITTGKSIISSGAGVVGMSGLPELCVAAVYNIPTLFLCFVTNDPFSPHSHEENQKQAKAKSKQLGDLIKTIVGNL